MTTHATPITYEPEYATRLTCWNPTTREYDVIDTTQILTTAELPVGTMLVKEYAHRDGRRILWMTVPGASLKTVAPNGSIISAEY